MMHFILVLDMKIHYKKLCVITSYSIHYTKLYDYAKAQSAAKNDLPTEGKVFISLCDLDKEFAPKIAQGLVEQGFSVVATGGTYKVITDADGIHPGGYQQSCALDLYRSPSFPQ